MKKFTVHMTVEIDEARLRAYYANAEAEIEGLVNDFLGEVLSGLTPNDLSSLEARGLVDSYAEAQ